MKPGDLEWTLQSRLNAIQARRTRPRAASRQTVGPRSARGRVSAIAAIIMVGALVVLGTASIFANEALDQHLCDPADENATLTAMGFECTYLFNKGQGTDSDPVGELYVKRDADDNVILVTDLNSLPDTGHEQPKLCVDDDTDPINLSVTEPDNGDKSCIGGTAADTVDHAALTANHALLKPAADPPEEGAGLYEVMVDNLVEGTLGAFGSYTVFVNGYTEFSLHFNEGDLSIEAFFQADPPGTKSGTKFEDPNGDGDLTDGVPLENWTINAYADDDGNGTLSATEFAAGAAATDVTDAAGDYELTLAPGDYIVCEVLTAGWVQTFPTAAHAEAGDCTTESGATDLGPVGYAISIASGDQLVDNDFGNFELVTKSGTKFNDVNGDGDLTDGVGLPGWTINLYLDDGSGVPDAGDTLVDSAVTDASGDYAFADLGPGTYFVCEASTVGWVQTFPNVVGGEVIDTCDDIAGNEAFGYTFTTESGVDLVDNDFGNFELPVLEGCTPGFWKVLQHHDAWAATGFTTGQTLESVFDIPDGLGLDDRTLVQALNFRGGSTDEGAAQILLRAAVAAILNAAHPDIDYEFELADIIADVNAALASGDRATILALASELDAANNAGCPLS
jgi:hypothetical protein